ncbi:MAG: response regulator transcription factor [Eubacterium sp.]|nr:response regulator transcription factor [Eubacterium sp.]MCM1304011.1 response regulator transcription factor [Butyrivibrio sp.]MCM1344757.1 response regulator transcription factor [Muribaculaceae bacterium]MCM1409119.1 response regulator transcription factor [Lachnospiraceae bacterium]
MKILLVEDNESIIMGLEYLLQQEGYRVRTARNMQEADAFVREEAPDLILLDIMLPDGNGFEFCMEVKRKWNFPVIFLTAKEEEADVVKGLDLGADDYIIKPFRNRELISRIRSVLRRNGKGSSALKCRDIVLDLESGKVSRAGEELNLTRLEYRILSTMLAYPDRLFTREEILADIWDISGNYVNDNTLSVTIKRIREKLGDAEGEIIKTVRGIGYRIER